MSTASQLNIVISGWYGQWNAGDDAILQVFVEQARKRLDCNIIVLCERPENIQKTARVGSALHLRPSIRGLLTYLLNGSLLHHLSTIKCCNLFVLGGGGLLRDNTSWRNLIRLLDEIWLGKLFGCKVMLYAIGVGPFRSRLGKFVIGTSVKMCDLITVRSQKDAQLLHELGVPSARIHVVADPAFLLAPQMPNDIDLIASLSAPKKIGVFPNFGLKMDGQDFSHISRLAAALDRLAEEMGVQFIIFPMRVCDSGMDDVKVAKAIKSAMKRPDVAQIYDKRLTPSELKWIAGNTMLNITLRLHAMIFSLGANIPVVPINYEPKVANVFRELECAQYLVEMDSNFDVALIKSVKQCLADLPHYSQTLAERNPANQAAAALTFDLMHALYPNCSAN